MQIYSDIAWSEKLVKMNPFMFFGQVGSFGVYLQNGYVFVTFHLGGGDVLGRSKMVLKVDEWYHIHVVLVGKEVYLVITDDAGIIDSDYLPQSL